MASEQVSQKFSVERNVWAPCAIAVSPSPVSSQRKRSCSSNTSAGPARQGPTSPIRSRTAPDPAEVGPERQGDGWESGPAPAGAVRAAHGERVGLRVEHPVFQGEHVIFREQKIEVPVPRQGGGPDTGCQRSGEGGTHWEGLSGASVTGLCPRAQGGRRPQICPEGSSPGGAVDAEGSTEL